MRVIQKKFLFANTATAALQSWRCACVLSCGKAQTQFPDFQTVFTHHVVFIMFNKIGNPALWNAVCNPFLETGWNTSTFVLYGEQTLSSSIVWRWVWLFNEWRENVRDNLWSGRLSVVNEDLVRRFEEKIRENRQFTITSLSLHFPQISMLLLHEIVSDKLKFRKFCAHCVLKMLT